MTISVEQNEDGSFDISWDENDPQESIFNTWTKKDFETTIANYLNELEREGKDLS